MKYGVKLLLWTNDPNSQGLFPVYLRVTINRDRRYIASGIFLQEKYWDQRTEHVKDGHPMHQVYNPDLTDRKQKVIRFIVEKNMATEAVSAAQVKDFFSRGIDLHNIFDFIDEFKKNVTHKRKGSTLDNYEKFSRKLALFHGSRQLAFEEMNTDFLQRYEDSLRAEGLDGNYIFANFKMLRTFFNAARKRKVITCYPFSEYENPVYEQKDKDFLSLAELDRWEIYADGVTDPSLKQTATYFLLGCYAGFRLSDWLQFDLDTHMTSKRLKLRATKNGEWVTMPITARLKRTLARIAALPLTITEQEMNRSLKDIAKAVKINKKITTHTGRRTFAATMCAERGISCETAARLMGITIAVCEKSYYRVTQPKIDQECVKAWKGV